jgi:hypothetical protein
MLRRMIATFNFFGGMGQTYLEVAVFVKVKGRPDARCTVPVSEVGPLPTNRKKASSEEPAFV